MLKLYKNFLVGKLWVCMLLCFLNWFWDFYFFLLKYVLNGFYLFKICCWINIIYINVDSFIINFVDSINLCVG